MNQSCFDPACTRCPRLARFLADVRADHPDYHAKPVPPFGDRKAHLLIVGLAPGMHGANATGRPFTGDYAGILLYKTLHRFGFATAAESRSASDRLRLINCRITNAVKCLPPANKPTGPEIVRCNSFLKAELETLPEQAVIMALGRIAHEAVIRAFGLRQRDYVFRHGATHRLEQGKVLLDSYHCSRYNTQTRRLTEPMFVAVMEKAKKLVQP
ncbi:MAG TPA: uracil-DNA glycosylase [Gammaproteobacteria bacterium]|nr:uracil-DNA glycosylase [Gammaproteobacteria bacterium]